MNKFEKFLMCVLVIALLMMLVGLAMAGYLTFTDCENLRECS